MAFLVFYGFQDTSLASWRRSARKSVGPGGLLRDKMIRKSSRISVKSHRLKHLGHHVALRPEQRRGALLSHVSFISDFSGYWILVGILLGMDQHISTPNRGTIMNHMISYDHPNNGSLM